jgi:hypothetical protein
MAVIKASKDVWVENVLAEESLGQCRESRSGFPGFILTRFAPAVVCAGGA